MMIHNAPSSNTIRSWCLEALALATRSKCPRSAVGAILVDPERKVTVCQGYNGTYRKGPPKCGGDHCLRTSLGIASGEKCEIGCVHAEINLLANASYLGIATRGRWVVVTREPCGSCEKALVSAGVERVIVTEEELRNE